MKNILEYEVTNGFHCDNIGWGDKSITTWDDGSSANYGTLTGITNCETICSMHDECAGFVHRTSDGVCGLWKREPLTLYSRSSFNCHQKLTGGTLICI